MHFPVLMNPKLARKLSRMFGKAPRRSAAVPVTLGIVGALGAGVAACALHEPTRRRLVGWWNRRVRQLEQKFDRSMQGDRNELMEGSTGASEQPSLYENGIAERPFPDSPH